VWLREVHCKAGRQCIMLVLLLLLLLLLLLR
jgi:hypothetical protein